MPRSSSGEFVYVITHAAPRLYGATGAGGVMDTIRAEVGALGLPSLEAHPEGQQRPERDPAHRRALAGVRRPRSAATPKKASPRPRRARSPRTRDCSWSSNPKAGQAGPTTPTATTRGPPRTATPSSPLVLVRGAHRTGGFSGGCRLTRTARLLSKCICSRHIVLDVSLALIRPLTRQPNHCPTQTTKFQVTQKSNFFQKCGFDFIYETKNNLSIRGSLLHHDPIFP